MVFSSDFSVNRTQNELLLSFGIIAVYGLIAEGSVHKDLMIIKVLKSIYANTANCMEKFTAQIHAHFSAGANRQLCHKNRGSEHVKTEQW